MQYNSYTSKLNQYHLGLWYASYRFIISFCLLLVYVISSQQLLIQHQHPRFYLSALLLYFVFNSVQLLLFRYMPGRDSLQFLGFFIVDVVALSSLTFATHGPSLHLSLLFVITIFAASLLLTRHQALITTLIAVICVIYQHFLSTLLDFASLNNVSHSVLLAFLFFVVYACGQLAIRRFQVLENLNLKQSLELRRLQDINRYILEQIETGYLVIDENYHVIFSTPAACQLLNISPFYAYHKKPLYLIQEALFEILHLEQLHDGERFQFEPLDSQNICSIHVQKLIIPNQTLTLLVIQDAQRLNQRVQQLKLAALGQLSASIAHEIRNPLAAIVQANELLKDSEPEHHAMLTQMISKQSQRIDQIIQDTLSMVRNKETQPIAINLQAFTAQLIEEDLADITEQIQLNIEPTLYIQFDESQLRQILINLIRNAIRHNDPNHPYIELHSYSVEKMLRIDVRDFGEGVKVKDQAKLFQPFFSTEINGTGLGLYLSHSFAEANQAKLSYVSQQQGACFRLECRRLIIDV